YLRVVVFRNPHEMKRLGQCLSDHCAGRWTFFPIIKKEPGVASFRLDNFCFITPRTFFTEEEAHDHFAIKVYDGSGRRICIYGGMSFPEGIPFILIANNYLQGLTDSAAIAFLDGSYGQPSS